MTTDQELRLIETIRKMLVEGNELLNIIDQSTNENVALTTRINVINSSEEKSRDDLKFLNMVPERIKHNEETIKNSMKILFTTFGLRNEIITSQ